MGKLITFTDTAGQEFSVDAANVDEVSPGSAAGTVVIRYAIGMDDVYRATIVGTVGEITEQLNALNG